MSLTVPIVFRDGKGVTTVSDYALGTVTFMVHWHGLSGPSSEPLVAMIDTGSGRSFINPGLIPGDASTPEMPSDITSAHGHTVKTHFYPALLTFEGCTLGVNIRLGKLQSPAIGIDAIFGMDFLKLGVLTYSARDAARSSFRFL